MTLDHIRADNALQNWTEALASLVSASGFSHITRVHVIGETGSTQDMCRHCVIDGGGVPGIAVTTLRQTAGRGRLGRAWNDPDGHGVACSFAVALGPPERLALAGALAACLAVESVTEGAVRPRLRWPNDVMLQCGPAEWKKVSGVLVELPADPPVAVMGIGVNVSQPSWPAPLDQIAISLAQAGCTTSRLEVVIELIRRLDEVLDWSDARLTDAFTARDMLTGTVATFEHARQRYTGTVIRVDPMQGLQVQIADGSIVALPALTTSLVHDDRLR